MEVRVGSGRTRIGKSHFLLCPLHMKVWQKWKRGLLGQSAPTTHRLVPTEVWLGGEKVQMDSNTHRGVWQSAAHNKLGGLWKKIKCGRERKNVYSEQAAGKKAERKWKKRTWGLECARGVGVSTHHRPTRQSHVWALFLGPAGA